MSLKDKYNIYIIVDNIDDFYNKLKLDTVYDVDLNRKYCNDNVGHSIFQKVKSMNNNNDLIRLLAIFSEISMRLIAFCQIDFLKDWYRQIALSKYFRL